ncbi:MAG: GNAT family N-acetyltransferase [Clostridia bacterium]|nr:GNAT family N-acetyltransferase [Clostridia bacterium]
MKFIRVTSQNKEHIDAVYSILEICGKDMYEKKGLTHWLKPYPMEFIIRDADEKYVYLAEKEGKYVATFAITIFDDYIYIGKVGVLPECAKKGIGVECMKFADNFAIENNRFITKVDVYDKSEHAVKFFTKIGYEITGGKDTTNFHVYLMEKHLNGGAQDV